VKETHFLLSFPYVRVPSSALTNHRVSSSGKKEKRQRAFLTARQAVRAAPQADTAEDRRGNHHHQRAQVRDEAAQLAAACEKRTLFLNFSYVCPESVLTKDHFQSIKWLKKGIFRTEASVDGLACQELQENGLLLSFPYVCPEPVLVK
jgi:hypothetical protein